MLSSLAKNISSPKRETLVLTSTRLKEKKEATTVIKKQLRLLLLFLVVVTFISNINPKTQVLF